jgi:four helix bundle protein
MRDFRQFNVWKKARDLVMDVYSTTVRFPAAEQYGLTSQLRRAAISVAANIAEGSGRGSDQEFARFLDMAMGSVAETRCHLLLAQDLGYLTPEVTGNLSEQAFEVNRMLNGLAETLRGSETERRAVRSRRAKAVRC